MRVGVAGSVDGVRCLAFETANHGMVAQLLNSRKQPAKVELEWHGAVLALDLPALSIGTYLWNGTSR